MILPRCPEPLELGGMPIEEIRRRLKEETLEYTKQILSSFCSYLWIDCDWKSILKEKGLSWPEFEKIISRFYADIKNWILEGITWENLLDIIENSRPMQNYLMQE
ncbi:MAG: hypothetical protein WBD09_09055 [Halobacteriota archaeon]